MPGEYNIVKHLAPWEMKIHDLKRDMQYAECHCVNELSVKVVTKQMAL